MKYLSPRRHHSQNERHKMLVPVNMEVSARGGGAFVRHTTFFWRSVTETTLKRSALSSTDYMTSHSHKHENTCTKKHIQEKNKEWDIPDHYLKIILLAWQIRFRCLVMHIKCTYLTYRQWADHKKMYIYTNIKW